MRAKPTPEQALNFLPARLGGTGAGFTQARDKAKSPVYLGALKPGNSLSDRPYLSIMSDDTPQQSAALLATVTPEVLEARARVVSLSVLDRLGQLRDSMDVSELVDTLKEAGKLSGVQKQSAGGMTINLGSLHLAALQAPRPVSNEVASVSSGDTVDAQLLPNPIEPNDLG